MMYQEPDPGYEGQLECLECHKLWFAGGEQRIDEDDDGRVIVTFRPGDEERECPVCQSDNCDVVYYEEV